MPDGSNYVTPAGFPPPSSFAPNPDYVPAYVETATRWVYDIDQANGRSRATYFDEVYIGGQAAGNRVATQADIASATTGVATWNGRSGTVVMAAADITSAGGAPAVSPTFTGTPSAPTAAPGTSTGQLATTQFVSAAIGAVQSASVASFNGRTGSVVLTGGDITTAGGAPAASPTLTGTPTAPTAAVGNASGQIASTQFVSNAIAAGAVVSWQGRQGAVTMTLGDVTSVGGAPIASPVFTGTPAGPTAAPGTSTTQLASTAYVMNAVAAATTGVASFNGRTGTVVFQQGDLTGVGGALLAGPTFTGVPSAPTATAGTSTTQLATTAFVANAITGLPGVSTFNGRAGAVTFQLADGTSVGLAPTASPTLTGVPLSTTAATNTNTTQIATTAFVVGQAATVAPVMNSTAVVGTSLLYARQDHGHASDTSRAPVASPTFTGTVTIPAGAAIAGYAPLASPTFTGTPAAPTAAATAAAGTTQVATTAFVRNGTTTSDNALAGQVGEFVFAQNGAGTAMTNSVNINLVSISLTAGDWDVEGMGSIWPSVTCTNIAAGVSATSATLPGVNPGGIAQHTFSTPVYTGGNLPTGRVRMSFAATTTVYLVGMCGFASGTCTGYAMIEARRVR